MRGRLILLSLLLGSVFAQTGPSFEAASVRVAAPCCAPDQWPASRASEERVDFRYVTLRQCIAYAFRVQDYEISAPSWLAILRFDIVAKAPHGTPNAQLADMLQALLKDRFGLRVHREVRELSGLAIVPNKDGMKLHNAKEDGDPSFQMGLSSSGLGKMQMKRNSMAEFADHLARVLHQPVRDFTGADGRYDFDLDFSPDDATGLNFVFVDEAPVKAPDSAVSLFTSIKKFGLRMQKRQLPVEVIVVDKAEKVPTEN